MVRVLGRLKKGGGEARKVYWVVGLSSVNTWLFKEPYIRSNLPGLKEALEENVFGQHIVTETVIK